MYRGIKDPEHGRGFELSTDHKGWKYAFSPTIGLSESIYKVDVRTHGLFDYQKYNSGGTMEEVMSLQGLTVSISLFWIQIGIYIGRSYY